MWTHEGLRHPAEGREELWYSVAYVAGRAGAGPGKLCVLGHGTQALPMGRCFKPKALSKGAEWAQSGSGFRNIASSGHGRLSDKNRMWV